MTMNVQLLVRELEAHGAVFELIGDRLRLRRGRDHIPTAAELAQLKTSRIEIISLLRSRGMNHTEATIAAIESGSPQSHVTSNDVHDAYGHQLRDLMRRICKQSCHEGLITWLQQSQFDLYEELTCILPNEIDHLCQKQTAPEVFQATLGRFFDAYVRARDLYEERMAIQDEGCGSGLSRGATFSGEGASR